MTVTGLVTMTVTGPVTGLVTMTVTVTVIGLVSYLWPGLGARSGFSWLWKSSQSPCTLGGGGVREAMGGKEGGVVRKEGGVRGVVREEFSVPMYTGKGRGENSGGER